MKSYGKCITSTNPERSFQLFGVRIANIHGMTKFSECVGAMGKGIEQLKTIGSVLMGKGEKNEVQGRCKFGASLVQGEVRE